MVGSLLSGAKFSTRYCSNVRRYYLYSHVYSNIDRSMSLCRRGVDLILQVVDLATTIQLLRE